jgi:hypothetical protein
MRGWPPEIFGFAAQYADIIAKLAAEYMLSRKSRTWKGIVTFLQFTRDVRWLK